MPVFSNRLRTEELLPIGSRIRRRLVLEYAPREELCTCLGHLLSDLLEVIEDRYDRSSTVIATQMPTKNWHEALADPTIADAICDCLVHNTHVVALRGPSIRRKKALKNGGTEGKN